MHHALHTLLRISLCDSALIDSALIIVVNGYQRSLEALMCRSTHVRKYKSAALKQMTKNKLLLWDQGPTDGCGTGASS
jgi:hypothetical protein